MGQLYPNAPEGDCQQVVSLLLAELEADRDGSVSFEQFCTSLRCNPRLRQMLYNTLHPEHLAEPSAAALHRQGSGDDSGITDEGAVEPPRPPRDLVDQDSDADDRADHASEPSPPTILPPVGFRRRGSRILSSPVDPSTFQQTGKLRRKKKEKTK